MFLTATSSLPRQQSVADMAIRGHTKTLSTMPKTLESMETMKEWRWHINQSSAQFDATLLQEQILPPSKCSSL